MLSRWADTNGFKFSSSKTVCMHFCRLRNAHPNPEFTLNGTLIPVAEQTKFLGVIFDNKLTFLPHIRYLKEKCMWRRWTFCVLLLTVPGEPTSRPCYIFIDRLFVLSWTMTVLCMVPRENLTYVYWIQYRTMHCGYASVPSQPHLPLGCVFKPTNLHSIYGEECWAYGIPSDSAHPRAIRLKTLSSSKKFEASFSLKPNQIPTLGIRIAPELEKIGFWIVYLSYLFQPLRHGF